jgi:7,8-dihydropterin-6-yl-methyl-4-(beta-D-ribofuranosyl)aminobenzene 5'-phosphate synthase
MINRKKVTNSFMKLKISILSENVASQLCLAEHGLSYLVEFDKKILFDTGASDLFIQNARRMDIDLDEIETIIISHGHYDHGNGLKYIRGKKIICHPAAFCKRFSGRQWRPVSLDFSFDELLRSNEVFTSKGPYWISDSMLFLGEIPRRIEFEKKEPNFFFEDRSPDPIIDDSAIAIKTGFGLFVVSGCAHSGICNTIEYACQLTGIDELYGVMGGFHLTENNEQVTQTIEYLKSKKAKIVMPSHCTGLPALSRFYEHFKGEMVKTGMVYTFPKTEEWFKGQNLK